MRGVLRATFAALGVYFFKATFLEVTFGDLLDLRVAAFTRFRRWLLFDVANDEPRAYLLYLLRLALVTPDFLEVDFLVVLALATLVDLTFGVLGVVFSFAFCSVDLV